ncbi:hypothetical protein F4821DRAFT_57875 [Hypoxylon rubiginosum]|uniref:Uncharacterized protein n=1 Tax=Hypoxylon rubiginosum TaxID=110542 RepID=A0ACC0DAA4_9PEZI|nr:hypothetical protein F4821DRAFT_57875 [Hypoxylon rubiginosum]
MAGGEFYFDASGPFNFKAPWLTFSSDGLPLPERQPEKSGELHKHKSGVSNPSDENEDELPPRKRQRSRYSNQSQVVSLLSSDDEDDSDQKPSPPRRSPKDRCHRPIIPPRVSASEGMAAAKRLSRAATRPAPPTETPKPAFSAEINRHPLGLKRFGAHTNSFEIKNKKLLVELGIEKPGSQRPGLSDPDAFENLADEITEYIIPDLPSDPSSTSPPPSSYIPLDVD